MNMMMTIEQAIAHAFREEKTLEDAIQEICGGKIKDSLKEGDVRDTLLDMVLEDKLLPTHIVGRKTTWRLADG